MNEFLKNLLGDSYQEGMTLDEVSSALEGIHAKRESENSKLKTQLQRANSEAAGYKKQLREKMTEAEQAESDRKSELDKVLSELAELKRDKAISDYTAQLTAIGYDVNSAKECAGAILDGDFAKLLQHQSNWMTQQKKEIEKELMGKTPRGVNSSSVGTANVDYSKKIEEARTNGDLVSEVYYTRLQQGENVVKG